MKRFVVLYFLFLAVLFVFLYLPISPAALFLNRIQTDLTLSLLNRFLVPGQLQGIDIMINPHYKIVITQACNGLIPLFFLIASILAYPAALLHKVFWMIMGYLSFTLVNVARILFVVHWVGQAGGRENFHWSHDIVGNAVLLSVGLGLFIAFIKSSTLKKRRF